MTVTSYIVLALTCFVSAHAAGWSYEDTKKWSKDYKACDGKSQSPINVVSSMAKYEPKLVEFKLTGYATKSVHSIVNNGHTIQLNIGYTALAEAGGLTGSYKAAQLHFHWSADSTDEGSEHLMNNKAYPLELHIVHVNQGYFNVSEALQHTDGLAVLGFFFEIGEKNPALEKFLSKIPQIGKNAQSESFSLTELIGSVDDLDDYFRYAGSLTTPPCSEAVVWTLFNRHLTISKEQLKMLWAVTDSHSKRLKNYRPTQGLNGRDIYTSIESSGIMTTAISMLVFFSALLSANLW